MVLVFTLPCSISVALFQVLSVSYYFFSDLVNGLILLMNSNFSEPVNIVSKKLFLFVFSLIVVTPRKPAMTKW